MRWVEMMMHKLDMDIRLEPMNRISSSNYHMLIDCNLRGVLAQNRKEAMLPSSPSSKIGSIIHELLELAATGKIRNNDDFDKSWDQACKETENRMMLNPLEKQFVPLSNHIDYYEVKKIMVFKLIMRLLEDGVKDYSSAKNMSSEAETLLESPNHKVVGIIDLIRESSSGKEIVDYKTGEITEIVDGHKIVKKEYEVQLKLYCALYYETYKEWPIRLAIIGMDGKELEIPFVEEECLSLLREADGYLDELNNKISQGLAAKEFACPKPISCKYCIYRPICIAYWNKRDDNNDWPNDAIGNIIFKERLGNGLFRVILQNGDKKYTIRGLDPERHTFLSQDIKKVIFCNLVRDRAEGHYTQTRYTVGYPLE